jgi:hypothetical protein
VKKEALVFGNHGALFMNAMTWWDHKTGSVWSQVWGQALEGPLRGATLELIASELVPWETWRAAHPDTLALQPDGSSLGSGYRPETFQDLYVIGVALDGAATAFPYRAAAAVGLINDHVGSAPVLVAVDTKNRRVHVYLRLVEGRTLTFWDADGVVQDRETGSTWRLGTGTAVNGPLAGQVLRALPYVPAFPFAWKDFYPDSRWYLED